jgi:peroxiredoxin
MRFLFSFHLLSFKAWAEDQKVTDTIIKFYGDPTGAFSKAVDMEMNHPVSCL